LLFEVSYESRLRRPQKPEGKKMEWISRVLGEKSGKGWRF